MQIVCRKGVALVVYSAIVASAFAEPAWAQTAVLYGTVRDRETGEPLPSATVKVQGTALCTKTDAQGKYRLEGVPIGRLELQASFVGYKPETIWLQRTGAAQEVNFALEPHEVEKAEVEVQSERERAVLQAATQSIATMSAADLDKHRGQTLGETLSQLPGVTILQTGPSIAKPVVRGLHSQRVLVINAGVRQEGQQWGAEHAPEIDPFAVAKIEVLKGAASVEYGADAIGGVVRLEPRLLPTEASPKGELTLNLFSNNAQGALSGLLEGKLGEQIGWRVQASWRRAGDAAAPSYFLTNTGFTELNFSAHAGYTGDWGELTAYYSRFSTELGILKSAHIGNVTDLVRSMQRLQPTITDPFSFAIDFPRQRISHDLVSLRASLQMATLGKVQLAYGYQQNIRQEFDAHVPIGTDPSRREVPAFDLTLFTHTAEARFQHSPIGKLLGTIGVALTAQSNHNLGRAALIPNFAATTLGGFWREEWVQDNWTLSAGVRYDVRWQSASPYGSSRIAQQLARGEIPNQQMFQTITGALGAIWQFAKSGHCECSDSVATAQHQ
ncbi:MAG: TonB-dependent receptor plug domain-containing protein [Chloroherpetonaceae bacterium]|nr:TonB-dependent receptor plug domain-containing protein [Chloroherpetonaceae bacterium]